MTKKTTLLIMLFCVFLSTSSRAQTLLSEGFEGTIFPPSGWTSFIGTNGLGTVQDWIQAAAPNTGTYSAANQYENVVGGIAEDWLVTSQIDLTSATNTELNFFSTQSWGDEYGSTYEVKVSTASQTTHADFTTVASYTESTVGDGFTLKTVDLSAYDGLMIYIAFVHYNDDGDNWIIDDVEVRSPLNLDASIDSVNLNRYSLVSVNNQLSLDVYNNGSATINSLDVSWNDGTNNYSENISVNIPSGSSQTVNHSTQVNYGSIVEKDISVTITSVNGTNDNDTSNNSSSLKFNTITQAGTKAVLIEESTGTWCGFCPRGTVGLNYMSTTYPNTVVAIAVHNGDPMVNSEYDTNLVGTIGSGWPNSGLDRKIVGVDPGQSTLENAYNTQILETVPVDLLATATSNGSSITITAKASFYTNFSAANFRLGVIITEDGVTGTTSQYNHVNYYSGGGLGPMGGYENLPDPVPASQMVYDHVGRTLLGGFSGQPGSVPTTITNGDEVQYNFNYTVPPTSTQSNMHIVAVLIDQTDGTIVNTVQTTIDNALNINSVSTAEKIKLYPNPAKNNFNIVFEAKNYDYNVRITDMLGRVVFNNDYENLFGIQNLEIPTEQLNNGQYIVSVSNGKSSYSQHLIINK